jgi:hypothetical protein
MNTEKTVLRAAGHARTFLPSCPVTALAVVVALPVTSREEALEFCGAFYVAEKAAEAAIDGGASTPALRDALVAAWRRLLDAARFDRAAVQFTSEAADAHLGLGDDAEFETLRGEVAAAGGAAFWHEQCLAE